MRGLQCFEIGDIAVVKPRPQMLDDQTRSDKWFAMVRIALLSWVAVSAPSQWSMSADNCAAPCAGRAPGHPASAIPALAGAVRAGRLLQVAVCLSLSVTAMSTSIV